ncbi:odorant receptor 4-like [Frieseomelitta varia]|uniref:odorant receptor 4-like n=1 Tax=Frieseomelitta varia TaxID=561572 RepID=UPI001CB679BF|nr:odorant receptor 4-like [Frieseomelitta varia]
MSLAKNAEDELRDSMSVFYSMLKITGAWSNPNKSSLSSVLLKTCIIFISYFLQLATLVPSILYAFTKENNGRRRIKLLMPHVNNLCQLIKYTILIRRMKEFGETIEEIRNSWLNATEENREIFRTYANFGRKVVIGLVVTMFSGGLSNRTIIPLVKGRIVLPNNTTIRLLSCPSYFVFFDEQVTPNYEIIYILQIFGGFFTYTTLCATMGACTMFCLHICSLLRILTNKMVELSDQLDLSENAVQEKIADIVEHRTMIKRFSTNIDRIIPSMCFFEMINDTLVACVVGYCIIMEWENNNVTAIVVYLLLETCCVFVNFTMCYIGQLLINESETVRQTCTTLNWYRFPMNKARYLVLVIIISNYRIKITAAKVVDVSLATFTDIMKASVGYLNMLRTTVQ